MIEITSVKCPVCGSEDYYCFTPQNNVREVHVARAKIYWAEQSKESA